MVNHYKTVLLFFNIIYRQIYFNKAKKTTKNNKQMTFLIEMNFLKNLFYVHQILLWPIFWENTQWNSDQRFDLLNSKLMLHLTLISPVYCKTQIKINSCHSTAIYQKDLWAENLRLLPHSQICWLQVPSNLTWCLLMTWNNLRNMDIWL